MLLEAHPDGAAFARPKDLDRARELRRRWFEEAQPGLLELRVGSTSAEVRGGAEDLIKAGGATVNHMSTYVAEMVRGQDGTRRWEEADKPTVGR